MSNGKLPKAKTLLRYSNARLLELLKRSGQIMDLETLEKSIGGILELYEGVKYMDPALVDHIAEQIESKTRLWLIDQTRKNIAEQRWQGLKEEGAKGSTLLRWLSVSDRGTCASCSARHNRIETMRTWQRLGPPGSGQLICRSRCRCRLIQVKKEKKIDT